MISFNHHLTIISRQTHRIPAYPYWFSLVFQLQPGSCPSHMRSRLTNASEMAVAAKEKASRWKKKHGERVMQCEISDQNGGSDVKNICKHCLFHCHVWLLKGNWSRMNHPKQTFVEKQSHLPGPKVTRLGTTKVWASQFHCEGEEMIGHNSRVHDAIWAHNKIIYI